MFYVKIVLRTKITLKGNPNLAASMKESKCGFKGKCGIISKPQRYTGEADYYTIGTGSTLLIVEDVVSAVIAVQEMPYITAMAILGTSMNPKHFEKIGEYDKVIIALDPDAIGKTVEYRREIELWTGRKTTAMNLQDDIKYKMEEDLEKLKELCNEISNSD